MNKIYISEELFNSATQLANVNSDFVLKCVGPQINNGIRRYSLWFPRTNSSVYYNVYYYQYDDLLNDYTMVWDSEQRSLPSSCLDVHMTQDIFYRKDITDILLCFFILVIIIIYFPYKIFSRAFGRWLKV